MRMPPRRRFQSTHPRGVRHHRAGPARLGYRVSIHAPAWGATIFTARGSLEYLRVSIHAPAWGATARHESGHPSPLGFNPRTRVGCDTASMSVLSTVKLFQSTHPRGVRHRHQPAQAAGSDVSIHAPAWGATRARSVTDKCKPCFNPRTRVGCDIRARPLEAGAACFNPRTRVGCDVSRGVGTPDPDGFQSTHPRGVRRGGCCSRVAAISGFNPRTRVGCDLRNRPWPR